MSRTEWLLAGIFVFLLWLVRQISGQSPVSFGDITNKPVFNAVNGAGAEDVQPYVDRLTSLEARNLDEAFEASLYDPSKYPGTIGDGKWWFDYRGSPPKWIKVVGNWP